MNVLPCKLVGLKEGVVSDLSDSESMVATKKHVIVTSTVIPLILPPPPTEGEGVWYYLSSKSCVISFLADTVILSLSLNCKVFLWFIMLPFRNKSIVQ